MKISYYVYNYAGDRVYCNYLDKIHREVGPAFELTNGDKLWYFENMIHREDGPAILRSDGTVEWWQFDKRHKKNGPAVVRYNGVLEYWEFGQYIGPNPAVFYAGTTLAVGGGAGGVGISPPAVGTTMAVASGGHGHTTHSAIYIGSGGGSPKVKI